MKKLKFMPIVAAGIIALIGCNETNVKQTTDKKAIDLANLDTSVAPGTGFYQYACVGWMKNNPLKPEFARFGSFDQLRDENLGQIRSLIKELSDSPQRPGSVEQKIGLLYAMGMDSVKLNSDGYAPIQSSWMLSII